MGDIRKRTVCHSLDPFLQTWVGGLFIFLRFFLPVETTCLLVASFLYALIAERSRLYTKGYDARERPVSCFLQHVTEVRLLSTGNLRTYL